MSKLKLNRFLKILIKRCVDLCGGSQKTLNINAFLIVLVVILMSTLSCKKDDEVKTITRADYLGNYIGVETNSWGGMSTASFNITESLKGQSNVIINGVTRYGKVEGYVNDKFIYFDEQSFQIDYNSPGGYNVKYTAVYYGSGELDIINKKLRLEYIEKQVFDDTTYVFEWITVGNKQ